MLLYGRPPAVFDPSATATQTSPLIPGSSALETVAPGSADGVMLYAPPGAVERRYTLALALRALKPGGRLDVMAPKDKGGSRLGKELKGFDLRSPRRPRRIIAAASSSGPRRPKGWTPPSRRARRAWFRGWKPGRSRASSPGTGSIRHGAAGAGAAAAEGRGRRSGLRFRGAVDGGAARARRDGAAADRHRPAGGRGGEAQRRGRARQFRLG